MFRRLCARLKSTKPDRHAREKHGDQSQPPSTNDDDRIATRTDHSVSSLDEASTDNSPRRNLWEVAGERLDKKHREILAQESASPITNAIEGVIKTTEEKYREYKEGGLKIRKREGGQIDVRETAKNIILYALQAQELVKALVSFDPTGHGEQSSQLTFHGVQPAHLLKTQSSFKCMVGRFIWPDIDTKQFPTSGRHLRGSRVSSPQSLLLCDH